MHSDKPFKSTRLAWSWAPSTVLIFIALYLQGNLIDVAHLAQNDLDKPEAGFSCHLREMELCCVGAMSILHNPNGLPVNEQDLKRQCQYLDESAQCFDRYIESCLTTDQRQMVDMLAGDLFKIEGEFCADGTELRANYMKHATCFRAIQKDRQKTCVADLQVGLEPIHKLESGARLSSACCNINRLKDCILPVITDKCGDEAFELVRGVMERAFGNVLNVLCREYDPRSEKCKKFLPKSGTKPYNGRNTSAISRLISGYTAPMSQIYSLARVYSTFHRIAPPDQ